MSVDTVSTKPKLVAAEPQLFVADVNASCAFFTDKLGFSIVFTYGEPPYYAQVKRDGAALNLRCVEGAAIDPRLRDREELLSASITVASAGRDHAARARFPAGRRQLCADAGEEALGRARFHRQGYRRQPAAVRRTGGVASAQPLPPPWKVGSACCGAGPPTRFALERGACHFRNVIDDGAYRRRLAEIAMEDEPELPFGRRFGRLDLHECRVMAGQRVRQGGKTEAGASGFEHCGVIIGPQRERPGAGHGRNPALLRDMLQLSS